MNYRLPFEPAKDARTFADGAEQVARDVQRTVAAAKKIAESVRVLFDVISPLFERYKSERVLLATKRMRS